MILVDSNVLMYAVGGEHPNRAPAQRFLHRVGAKETAAVLSAEVLQEIFHRYRSMNRWKEAVAILDQARRVFPEVLAITGNVMDRAREILDKHPLLSARDGVHAAVVSVYGLDGICSYDRDFDQIPGLRRIEPA